jgi:hypothetical protein
MECADRKATFGLPLRLIGYSVPEEVAMRIVACGLIAGAALLGAAPMAMAGESTHDTVATNSDSHVAPQAEVSMLAVSLTVGGAVATAGSGAALALARRRRLSPPSRGSG